MEPPLPLEGASDSGDKKALGLSRCLSGSVITRAMFYGQFGVYMSKHKKHRVEVIQGVPFIWIHLNKMGMVGDINFLFVAH